jgi:DNA-nicking Smr family endonuclease
MTRARRLLSPEERELWALVARGVTPLHGRAPALMLEETAPAKPADPAPSARESSKKRPSAAERPQASASPRPREPALAPIERKMKLALRRGAQGVDAAVDLHGLRQAEAHDALIAFLRRSQAAGHTLVLVVTGKGGAAAEASAFEERGVLRRMAPHWLRLPELRPLVLGFEEAGPRHGGSGALYVRLRRARLRP